MTAANKTPLGVYLLDELRRRGVEHIFGVPGDYILRFDKLIEEHPVQYINTTRENTAGYMADAYARLKGLGVVCVTYGVGLNLVNAVSQAFMESSPLVVISGAPGASELKRSHFLHHLIHKSAGPYENTQYEIFKPITVYQALLKDVNSAAHEIQKALDAANSLKKPVYIELPRDVVLNEIHPEERSSKESPLTTFSAREIKEFLDKAKRPFIWVGHEVHRFDLAQPLLAFAEKWNIPLVTTLLGKTALDERHPLVYGVYQGNLSRPEIIEWVNQCDAVLLMGMIQNDIDTGIFTSRIPQIPHSTFSQERLRAAIAALPEISLNQPYANTPQKWKPTRREIHDQNPITTQRAFDILQSQVTEDLLWIADVGDCLFGASDLQLPQNHFVSNAYFSSLGFAVPGALGMALAEPQKRVVALVGDGAFQMTGMELSTAVRYLLNPIVILFNNKGYGTERPILDGKYNDIVNWNYALLPEVFRGGKGHLAKTEGEFSKALETALTDTHQFHLIEVDLDPWDFSDAAKRFGQVVQEAFKQRESLPTKQGLAA